MPTKDRKPFELHCHNCRKVLDVDAFKRGQYVNDQQRGYVFCDAKCQGAEANVSTPITLAEADAAEARATAFSKLLRTTDIVATVTEARRRADTLALLERALEASR